MSVARKVAFAVGKHALKAMTAVVVAKLAGNRLPKHLPGPKKLFGALEKEAKLGPVLDKEVAGALRSMKSKDPGLGEALRKAYGYAVFPSVGKATVVLGAAFGLGEVFVHGNLTNYAAVVQLTLGVQLGGTTFHELIVFDTKADLDRFKEGKLAFAANASAVLISAGAAASSGRKGTHVFVHSEGGMMLEAAIGGQKFIVKPAVLGRIRAPVPKATIKRVARLGAPAPPT